MDCWYPITIPRHNYYKDPVSKIVFSKVYGRLQVPCGRCPACRRRKQNEWSFRILEEAKYTRLCAFITLTYNDLNLPLTDSGVPTLDPKHLHTFIKNLRYDLGKQTFRYFACGEYGDQFERPHMHMILFYNGSKDHDYIKSRIERRWIHGFIEYDPEVTAGRAKYCAKYSMKQVGFDYGDCIPPFARMSRRPGIGKKFLDQLDFEKFRKLDIWCVHDYQGTPYNLPRYYRDAIYTQPEREQHSLLLERLKMISLDQHIREFGDSGGNYFEFDSYQSFHKEQQFIKLLKKENYGFKWKPFRPKERPKSSYGEEFVTDEF